MKRLFYIPITITLLFPSTAIGRNHSQHDFAAPTIQQAHKLISHIYPAVTIHSCHRKHSTVSCVTYLGNTTCEKNICKEQNTHCNLIVGWDSRRQLMVWEVNEGHLNEQVNITVTS